MRQFLTGARLSDPDPRDWLFHEGQLAGARPVLGDGSIDWRDLWTPRVQCANDCVGFTTAQNMELRSKLTDPTPIPFPSPLYLYQRGVRLGRPDRSFSDDGSQFRWVLKAARDSGIVAESDWPELAENIYRVPPAHLFLAGSVATCEGFCRIPDGAECKRRGLPLPSAQIHEAMRRKNPVASVMLVNRQYAEMGAKTWTGPIADDGADAWEGYHAQSIIVSDRVGRRFGLGSSWGADLGDGGIFWVSDDALNEHLAEFWIVQSIPGDL